MQCTCEHKIISPSYCGLVLDANSCIWTTQSSRWRSLWQGPIVVVVCAVDIIIIIVVCGCYSATSFGINISLQIHLCLLPLYPFWPDQRQPSLVPHCSHSAVPLGLYTHISTDVTSSLHSSEQPRTDHSTDYPLELVPLRLKSSFPNTQHSHNYSFHKFTINDPQFSPKMHLWTCRELNHH